MCTPTVERKSAGVGGGEFKVYELFHKGYKILSYSYLFGSFSGNS